MFTHTHKLTDMHTHIYALTHNHVHIHIYMYPDSPAHAHLKIHLHMHKLIPACEHMYLDTHTPTHEHPCVYTPVNICVQYTHFHILRTSANMHVCTHAYTHTLWNAFTEKSRLPRSFSNLQSSKKRHRYIWGNKTARKKQFSECSGLCPLWEGPYTKCVIREPSDWSTKQGRAEHTGCQIHDWKSWTSSHQIKTWSYCCGQESSEYKLKSCCLDVPWQLQGSLVA